MHIERSHSLGKVEAIRRIDTFVDGLMARQVPGGISILDSSKSWAGDVMQFSVTAKKLFMSTTLSGTVRVTDDSVVMDSDVPGLVTTLISEDKIRDLAVKELDRLLAA